MVRPARTCTEGIILHSGREWIKFKPPFDKVDKKSGAINFVLSRIKNHKPSADHLERIKQEPY